VLHSPKRQLSDSKEKREASSSRLRTVEEDLEDLIGRRPTSSEPLLTEPHDGIERQGYRKLTDDERQAVARYLRDSTDAAFETLSRALGLTAMQTTRVVKSEQKRIAHLAYQDRKIIDALGKDLYEAIREYVDQVEDAIKTGMAQEERGAFARRRKALMAKFNLTEAVLAAHAYREMHRRYEARQARNKPIDVQGESRRQGHIGEARPPVELTRRESAAAGSELFQSAISREERARLSEEDWWMQVLEDPGNDAQWLYDMITQWDEAYDYDALLAGEDEVAVPPLPPPGEAANRKWQYDALEGMLEAFEALEDADAGAEDADAGILGDQPP
jgi:hypothetical protein